MKDDLMNFCATFGAKIFSSDPFTGKTDGEIDKRHEKNYLACYDSRVSGFLKAKGISPAHTFLYTKD